mmetsp:Transcript_6725/g.25996  ORF Transcript_6725/g.25996 Transcript_6725/m.25996 type:complete len:236 (+) Transcript_6725:750-1457(+)
MLRPRAVSTLYEPVLGTLNGPAEITPFRVPVPASKTSGSASGPSFESREMAMLGTASPRRIRNRGDHSPSSPRTYSSSAAALAATLDAPTLSSSALTHLFSASIWKRHTALSASSGCTCFSGLGPTGPRRTLEMEGLSIPLSHASFKILVASATSEAASGSFWERSGCMGCTKSIAFPSVFRAAAFASAVAFSVNWAIFAISLPLSPMPSVSTAYKRPINMRALLRTSGKTLFSS